MNGRARFLDQTYDQPYVLEREEVAASVHYDFAGSLEALGHAWPARRSHSPVTGSPRDPRGDPEVDEVRSGAGPGCFREDGCFHPGRTTQLNLADPAVGQARVKPRIEYGSIP